MKNERYGWRLIQTALMLIEKERAHEEEVLNAACFLFVYLGIKTKKTPEKLLHMITVRIAAILEAQAGEMPMGDIGEA